MAAAGPAVDDPVAARREGADWLSVALIDARNRSLRWLAAIDASPAGPLQPAGGLPSALWLAGHAAWWGEHWILRHVQAARGERADPDGPRLASIDPRAAAFEPARRSAALAGPPGWAEPDAVRAYLGDTLESLLELLARLAAREGHDGAADDDALYGFRQALRVEDRCAERLAGLANALAVADAPWPALREAPAERPPIALPPRRHRLGSDPGGLVPGPERWAHDLDLPELEIDAQPVGWAQWAEFAADGGYDEPRWWTDAGWAWAQRVRRNAPRHVETWRGGAVVARHAGRLQRLAPTRAATHLTRHEAEAWCRWAGRRLPTEAEWEHAALGGAGRGFVWGDALEWVAGRARAYPGHADPAGEPEPLPPPGAGFGVLRGAAPTTPPRAAHPRARRFATPDDDHAPSGFRSCAV